MVLKIHIIFIDTLYKLKYFVKLTKKVYSICNEFNYLFILKLYYHFLFWKNKGDMQICDFCIENVTINIV